LIPETKRKTLEELAGEVSGTPNFDPRLIGQSGKAYREGSEDNSTGGVVAGNEKNV
jgi:PHS family inorganic phosphate transporter-like MFS transporter